MREVAEVLRAGWVALGRKRGAALGSGPIMALWDLRMCSSSAATVLDRLVTWTAGLAVALGTEALGAAAAVRGPGGPSGWSAKPPRQRLAGSGGWLPADCRTHPLPPLRVEWSSSRGGSLPPAALPRDALGRRSSSSTREAARRLRRMALTLPAERAGWATGEAGGCRTRTGRCHSPAVGPAALRQASGLRQHLLSVAVWVLSPQGAGLAQADGDAFGTGSVGRWQRRECAGRAVALAAANRGRAPCSACCGGCCLLAGNGTSCTSVGVSLRAAEGTG